jgi:hypothetical protein
MKDDNLLRDGFKKFLKTEECYFPECRFSKVCNHIHCIRGNCSYVLHSSGQLLSHKRKHEKMDGSESSSVINFVDSSVNSDEASVKTEEADQDKYPMTEMQSTSFESMLANFKLNFTTQCTGQANTSDNQSLIECFIDDDYLKENHVHCLVKDCNAVIRNNPIDLYEHLSMHKAASFHSSTIDKAAPTVETDPQQIFRSSFFEGANHAQMSSINCFFNRKRGRPPKNRIVELYNDVNEMKYWPKRQILA